MSAPASIAVELDLAGIEDDGDISCSACNGTGEGCADGLRCSACGGLGVLRPEREYDYDETSFCVL